MDRRSGFQQHSGTARLLAHVHTSTEQNELTEKIRSERRWDVPCIEYQLDGRIDEQHNRRDDSRHHPNDTLLLHEIHEIRVLDRNHC